MLKNSGKKKPSLSWVQRKNDTDLSWSEASSQDDGSRALLQMNDQTIKIKLTAKTMGNVTICIS